MKKIISLLLVLVLTLTMAATALADYDFSYVNQYDALFGVTKRDDGIAFIDTISASKIKDYSFTTPYESDQYYSYLYNDIIVIDYNTQDFYSVWRLWVEYTGTKAIKANSIDIMFDGHTFTFQDVYDDDNMAREENGDYAETYMIKIGSGSLDFLVALEDYITSLIGDSESPSAAIREGGNVHMTLHGANEDVTVTLPNNFLLDFELVSSAFLNADGNLADATNPTVVTGK